MLRTYPEGKLNTCSQEFPGLTAWYLQHPLKTMTLFHSALHSPNCTGKKSGPSVRYDMDCKTAGRKSRSTLDETSTLHASLTLGARWDSSLSTPPQSLLGAPSAPAKCHGPQRGLSMHITPPWPSCLPVTGSPVRSLSVTDSLLPRWSKGSSQVAAAVGAVLGFIMWTRTPMIRMSVRNWGGGLQPLAEGHFPPSFFPSFFAVLRKDKSCGFKLVFRLVFYTCGRGWGGDTVIKYIHSFCSKKRVDYTVMYFQSI